MLRLQSGLFDFKGGAELTFLFGELLQKNHLVLRFAVFQLRVQRGDLALRLVFQLFKLRRQARVVIAFPLERSVQRIESLAELRFQCGGLLFKRFCFLAQFIVFLLGEFRKTFIVSLVKLFFLIDERERVLALFVEQSVVMLLIEEFGCVFQLIRTLLFRQCLRIVKVFFVLRF